MGLEPEAVGADQNDKCDRGAAELSSETCNVVKDWILRGVQNLILRKGLVPEGFVFDQERVHLITSSW